MKHFHKFTRHLKVLIAFFCLIASLPRLNAQTQGLTDSVHKATGIAYGYYYSLPVDYAANPTKSYPLLIALHGSGETGNGTTQLADILSPSGTIPYILNNNTFQASFEVDGETFSFIVVCPQYSTGFSAKTFMQYLKTQYRIDTTRIYFTGLSEGAAKAWHNVKDTLSFLKADAIAAMVLTSPSISDSPYLKQYHVGGGGHIIQANTSNLPLWLTQNNNEGTSTAVVTSTVDKLTTNFNGLAPYPQPLAKKQVFTATGHNSWVRVYNAANEIDSANDYNIYQWMLQFTNKRLVAKAGKDTIITLPADSITLNGSKSTVRQGRIKSYLWTKISGGSATITNDTLALTGVSGLGGGTYQFELKLTHSDNTTIVRDTVTVTVNGTQTQTKVGQNVSTNIKGYLLSLPVGYSTDTAKKFPLIISLHGADAVGDSSAGAPLDSVANQGIPKLIRDGQFPTSFEVEGKDYSFIVVSPQINSSTPSFIHNQLNTLVNYIKSNYRVDVERVYVAGLGIGGGFGYTYAIGGTTTTNIGYPDSIAAMVGAGSNVPSINSTQRARLVQSNLPHWLTHNNADPVIASSKSSNAVSTYNGSTPAPLPLAGIRLFASSVQDSWTTTYDPDYILDSSTGYNVYKWLLQYTNKRVVARAGEDTTIVSPVDSVTLNGSNSTTRNGRASYLWTQVQGTGASFASSTSAVTKVNGLSTGVNKFELTVTHDSTFTGNSVKDTVTVTVNGSSPRIAAPAVNLAPAAESTDEILRVRISPTVAQSQITILIDGKAKGKTNLQLSGMDGKRLQLQSFVKDGAMITRSMSVSSLPSGTYIVEVIVAGKYRKVLRFIRQ